ncbi:MAG: ABC transporter permease [Chitinophagaceae bacterium]
MFRNYLKTAWRNIRRSKVFSFINVLGLAIGLSVCLLIVLYVKDELNYDKYNTNADRIYRVDSDLFFNGSGFKGTVTPFPLGPALVRDYPHIEQMVRLWQDGDVLVKKGDRNLREQNLVFADSTLFKVFTLPMLAGNPATALNDPDAIVMDESTAKKYFNTTNVVGQTLILNDSIHCKITGVIKDIPAQSHFHFNFIRPLGNHGLGMDSWLNNNATSYLLVKPGTTPQQTQKDVDATVNNYLSKQLQALLHVSLNDAQKSGYHFLYTLMPLKDIHLHSDKVGEFEANGSMEYVYIFSVIAIFILLIACVNFMNLSTARSANRAKEVGVRKVAGSTRKDLIAQFLTESVLVSFLAMLLAVFIAAALLPLFNQLTGKSMHIHVLFSSWLLPVMVLLIFVVGCMAGSYPAFYLSAFDPAKVLKGSIAKGFKNSWLRSSLVVFQFCISIILMVSTIVIYNQLHFIQNKKIGYDRNQVLTLHNTDYLGKEINTFRNELLHITGVENATVSQNLPTSSSYSRNGWFRNAMLDATQVILINDFLIDENYIPTLGMQMAQGRNFSKDFPSDSSAIILNETAVKMLGFKKPLEATMYQPRNDEGTDKIKGVPFHVVGVVKDFNFSSMREVVGPAILHLGNSPGSISVRIDTKNISPAINSIQNKWSSMVPTQPFNYTFMDTDFANIYHAEQQTGKLFVAFAALAIFVACLGLYGLVTFAAEQRTKEIGVRKVLGASVGSIVTLLSKEFAKLIVIAMLIAFPVAWWAMHRWLQTFAYRTSLQWYIFLSAGVLAIVIALVTISYQAVKAARANPVKSLRTE